MADPKVINLAMEILKLLEKHDPSPDDAADALGFVLTCIIVDLSDNESDAMKGAKAFGRDLTRAAKAAFNNNKPPAVMQ